MTPSQYGIFIFGPLLEATILWRGLRMHMWRHYPFFYVCMGYVFISNVTLFVLSELQLPDYVTVYWFSEVVVIVLFFLIPWEIFRHAFAAMPSVRQVTGKVIVILLIGLAWTILYASRNLTAFPTIESFYYDLERKAAFAQAAFLLATVLLALYYHIPLGRNIRGMALGFGLFVSVSIMNYAALELMESFFPLWQYISPLTFASVLAVWTWALWSYAPNPEPNLSRTQESERRLAEWKHAWKQIRATLRKASGL